MELDTAQGIAQRFKLSPFTIRRLGYRGVVKVFRCGSAVRFDPDEIKNWMAQQGLHFPEPSSHFAAEMQKARKRSSR